jgi:hypothetical protein
MKKILLILIFYLVAFTATASETGELIAPVPFCKKRTTAISATILVTLAEKEGKSAKELEGGLDEVGCIYVNRSGVKLKIHKMTKDVTGGALVHYAQVSLISIDGNVASDSMQKIKHWIAYPFDKDKKVGMIKLKNGELF